MKIKPRHHHRGNATVSILLVGVLLVSVATLVLVFQIYQQNDELAAKPQSKQQKQQKQPSPQVIPAKGNPSVDTKPDGQSDLTIKPVLATTNRSPLPQPGEVIDKPIAPAVLAVPAELKATAPAPKDGEIVPWSKAKDHVGRTITIEGKIVAANNIGSICFLNFTNEPRGGDKFYLVVFKDKYSLFEGKPEVYFKNKTVRVTGEIEDHKGRPQMKIKKKEQVQVIEKQD